MVEVLETQLNMGGKMEYSFKKSEQLDLFEGLCYTCWNPAHWGEGPFVL